MQHREFDKAELPDCRPDKDEDYFDGYAAARYGQPESACEHKPSGKRREPNMRRVRWLSGHREYLLEEKFGELE